ncbi:hypothetical protein [Caenimonas aquaedulcis]|uniref:Uncharacterized protein n=1 Tax=Caenimonas aquaedulcis TaxID=2793270 RepID=A0A931H635_9BURK|nr:hypothetical protein [Caenimonas aquaedulcis]MBG9389335.1 hypothetical protein [Caenimonas aquaedulcis]
MTVLVEMTHPYLSLGLLVHAIAKAAISARKQSEDSGTPYEEAMGAAMLAWESRLRELCDQRLIKGHDFDSLEEQDWLLLKIDHDVFWVDDLNACKPLTDAGLQFVVVPDKEAENEFVQWFGESVHNGKPIDWEYWVLNMPTLSAAEAARLLCGLDPDVFKTLKERPNRNDASRAIAECQKIERLAAAHDRERESPENWLQWAKANRQTVERGFERAVHAKQKRDAPPIEFGGMKQRTVELAGAISTFMASDEEFEAMAREVDERQAKGHFTVAEAAQILAAHLRVDGGEMRKKLESAFFQGRLTVRHPLTEIPITSQDIIRSWLNVVYATDVDDLVTKEWKVTGYTFSKILAAESDDLPRTELPEQAGKKSARQRDRILERLRSQGHDPADLPERKAGRAGAKAACKSALLKERERFTDGSLLFTEKSFEKAWEELRRLKLVLGAE